MRARKAKNRKLVFQYVVLLPLLGFAGAIYHSLNQDIPAPSLCQYTFTDITDEDVIKLNLELSKEPLIPPSKAWLKAEAGACVFPVCLQALITNCIDL